MKTRTAICYLTELALWFFLSTPSGVAQSAAVSNPIGGPSKIASPIASIQRLPGDLQSAIRGLGARVRIGGQEQTITQGQLTNAGGTFSVRVIQELPQLVKIDGLKSPSLIFDGTSPSGATSRDDDVLLESFTEDTIEGFLANLRGQAVRLLGLRFTSETPAAGKDKVQQFDIFEVTAPSRTDLTHTVRSKRFYLDSTTGLLASTRYEDRSRGGAIMVETRFSDWKTLAGSAYPGRVERYENGQLIFTFVAGAITPQPAQGPTAFRSAGDR